MGIVKRQSIKLSMVSYLGAGLGFLNVFLFPGIFTQAQIGIFLSTIIPVASLLSLTSMLGSNVVALKFFPTFRDKTNGHNGLLGFTHIWIIIGLIIIGVLYWMLSEIISLQFPSVSYLTTYSEYIFTTTISLSFASIYVVLSQNFKRIVIPGLIHRQGIKISLLVGASLYYFKLISFNQFLWVIPINYGLGSCILLWYVLKIGGYRFSINVDFLKRLDKKDIISNAAYGLLLGVGSVIVYKIDLIMVPILSSLETAGTYVIAERMSLVIDMPTAALMAIVTPLLAEAWNKKDMVKIQELYLSSSLNLIIAGVFVSVILVGNLNGLYSILPNGELYSDGILVVLFLVVGKLIELSTSCNHGILMLSDKYRVNFYVLSSLIVVNICLNYVLIPEMGAPGAALASAISLMASNIFKTFYLYKVYGLWPFDLNSLKVFTLGGVLVLLLIFSPDLPNPYLTVVVKSALVFLLYVFTLYKIKVSQDFNSLIEKFLPKLSK